MKSPFNPPAAHSPRRIHTAPYRVLPAAAMFVFSFALVGNAEEGIRTYENRLVELHEPPPLLADYPQFVQPVQEVTRYEAPLLVNDEGADLEVRAWRFSYNARGIIEMPNRLNSQHTAVIMVHPWGIDDGQGWRTPQPAGVADFCTTTKNHLAGRHTREVIDPFLQRLRPHVALTMFSMRAGEQDVQRKMYRSIRRTPTALERAEGKRELREILQNFRYQGSPLPTTLQLSSTTPVIDYFRQFPGLDASATYNNEGFWQLPVPVCSDVTMHDDDVVIYDDDGYPPLRDFLKEHGVRHVLLTGYATDMCFCKTTAGYENLSRDFNVFLVGDATLATFPANDSPRYATNAHISFASLNQLITQVSWVRHISEPNRPQPSSVKTGAVEEADSPLQLASFSVDVTPPQGSPLCDALVPPVDAVDDPLTARGVILLPHGQQPIVLVAVDWVGIGNDGHEAWRQAIAKAAGTSTQRVCVHALHQHDAPGCDFLADDIAAQFGLGGHIFNVNFARQAIRRVAQAVHEAITQAEPVTHVGRGEAVVEGVASNRRILGPDGRVKHVRFTTCTDPEVRAYPAGIVDDHVNSISFWQQNKPLAVLTYFATHPQSYYGEGRVSCDFVGLARNQREQELSNLRHIHFNGAGGNVGAGKFNDGAHENRQLLAQRLADGMQRAWEATERFAVPKVDFATTDVTLPVAEWLTPEACRAVLTDPQATERNKVIAARHWAWHTRCESGRPISIARLRIGSVDILQMPGELFVEYQLAARALRPQSLVCMAAYGDYGPGYIGLHDAYAEGGYETGPVSRVAPDVERVLMRAIHELLE